MGVDPSKYPPPLRPDVRDDPAGLSEGWSDRLIITVALSAVAIILVFVVWAEQRSASRADVNQAKWQAQSDRETAACLKAGGLPHHDYQTGLIERCDR